MTIELQRRTVLSGAVAAAALLQSHAFAQSGPIPKIIPWSDQPPAVPPPLENVVKGVTPWEDLDSWITPNDKFFSIAHYDRPVIDAKAWRLDVAGTVAKPSTFTLADLKALPRVEIVNTIECSGNNGLPFAQSTVGNAQWAGASLADILRTAQIKSDAIEVVFYGVDQGEEVVRKDTPLEYKFTSNFARSMPLEDAMNPANLLCYEMNGAPLPAANGFPLRLVAPGWYGVANVKWLRRIEVRDTRFLGRFMGRFMGRDYVTIREEKHDGVTVMAETTVGRMLLKSSPAKVTLQDGHYRIDGMAWGPKPIAAVEVKVDNGPWLKAILEDSKSAFAWRSWHIDWSPAPGEHTVTSRAIDAAGNIQPAMDDPVIANKKTYWESNGQITRHIVVV
jgi:DMSO/TMAO reductase YedYZ molybdopterin-dependent catalytic subunit